MIYRVCFEIGSDRSYFDFASVFDALSFAQDAKSKHVRTDYHDGKTPKVTIELIQIEEEEEAEE